MPPTLAPARPRAVTADRERIKAELAEIVEARRLALAAEATARTVQHRRACARYIQHLNLRTLALHARLAA